MWLALEILVPFVTAAAGFLLAAALAAGAREDSYRAGYRAGVRAASLALRKISEGLVTPDAARESRGPGQ